MKATIKELAKREGKKSQVAIGNIREVLSKLTDMLAEEMVKDGFPEGDQFVNGFSSPVFIKEFCENLVNKSNVILKKKNMTPRFKYIFVNVDVNTNPNTEEKGNNMAAKKVTKKKTVKKVTKTSKKK